MQVFMLKSKLHRLAVTECRPDYEGSLAIDSELLDAVGLIPYEKVLVSNLANGHRFETYVVPSAKGSRSVCLLGPAARLGSVGDRIIVFSFAALSGEEVASHKPKVLVLDADNRPSTTNL